MTTKPDSNRREKRQRKEMGLDGEKTCGKRPLITTLPGAWPKNDRQGYAIDIISAHQKERII
jgi:hypothetical protein